MAENKEQLEIVKTVITVKKGTSEKNGRKYFCVEIDNGLTKTPVFDTALALILSKMTAEQLALADDGILAAYELTKI